jgi:hypothetical protein
VSEAYLGHPSHYFISYERLVQNPMLHTKRLVHWLGLDWEEQILDNYRQEAMHLTTSQEPWKNSNFRTITNKNRFAFPDLPWAARIIVESFNCYERLDRAMETH